MGHTSYSSESFTTRYTKSVAHGGDYFDHTSKISKGEVQAETHPLLDPARPNAAGKKVRESCDSPAHPCSVPVAVFFDVTGSMSHTPRVFVKELA
jgi:hypothetical protein